MSTFWRGQREFETHTGYEVVNRIGEGSMGVVYLAEHSAYGYRVAIKRLHFHLAREEELVERFLGEAEAASRIRHPGMVDIFEAGFDGLGIPYLVMDFLEGETLEETLARERFCARRTVELGRQIAGTLAAAHRAGIVHRDLKPANLYLVRDPASVNRELVKVLDFGVAKFFDDDRTHMRAFFGTPHYMAPEQTRGATHAGESSDIYALGCLLYYMAAGRLPFRGTIEQVILAQRDLLPVPPSEIESAVPAALETLILRLLEKEPSDRPGSMIDIAAELAALGNALRDEGNLDHTHCLDAA